MTINRGDPDFPWWNYGDYVAEQPCPNCARHRLMKCQDNEFKDRIICEKCNYEPATKEFIDTSR